MTIKGIKLQKKKSMTQKFKWLLGVLFLIHILLPIKERKKLYMMEQNTEHYLASGIPWQITSLIDLKKKRKKEKLDT